MSNQGWQPHTPYAMTPTGQEPAPAPQPSPTPTNHQAALREERLLAQIQSGFKSITPTLILTGIAIGFASAIGSALGAILVNRYIQKHAVSKRRSSRR